MLMKGEGDGSRWNLQAIHDSSDPRSCICHPERELRSCRQSFAIVVDKGSQIKNQDARVDLLHGTMFPHSNRKVTRTCAISARPLRCYSRRITNDKFTPSSTSTSLSKTPLLLNNIHLSPNPPHLSNTTMSSTQANTTTLRPSSTSSTSNLQPGLLPAPSSPPIPLTPLLVSITPQS